MYHDDVKAIHKAFIHQPGDTLECVVRFVLATIQQQFHTVGNILDEWDRLGYQAPTMWGMKKDGVKFIKRNKVRLAAQLQNAHPAEAIDILLTVPGLNTVKAGFAVQLLGMGAGCIDTHNARMYGIDVAAFKITPKHTMKTRNAKIRSYLALCDGLGGSPALWDVWCNFIADKQWKHWECAEEVSEMHVNWTVGKLKHETDRW